MSGGNTVRVRPLQAKVFVSALRISSNGPLLELDIGDSERQFGIGDLIELEDEYAIYLGEILRRAESNVIVQIDHSIDRAKLPEIEETWG